MTNRSVTLNALVEAQQACTSHQRPVVDDAFHRSGLSAMVFSATVNQLAQEENVWEMTPNVMGDWGVEEYALTVDMMQRIVSFQRPLDVTEERADGSVVEPAPEAAPEAAPKVEPAPEPEPNLDPPKTPPTKRGRLTESDVRQIITWRQGGETIASMASMFKVSTTCISNIVNGKTWQHLKVED